MSEIDEDAPEIYIARESAAVDGPNGTIYLKQGHTTVRAGHAILRKYPELFEPLRIDFDMPRRRPADETAPRTTTRPDQRGARAR